MFGFAFRNLLSRPARSALALAGLTVAIAGMVGLFGVKGGLEQSASDAFGRIDGLTALQPGAPVPFVSRLPAAWGDRISAVEGVETVVTDVWNRVNLLDGEMVVSPPRLLMGTSIPERAALRSGVYREAKVAGRFLNASDVGTTHVYVAAPILVERKKQVGDTLNIDGVDCLVVGSYEVRSLFLDSTILMDLGTMRRVTRFDPGTVCNFYIEGVPGQDPQELKDRILASFVGENASQWRPSAAALLSTGESPIQGLFNALDTALRGEPAPAPVEEPPATPVPLPTTAADATGADADEKPPLELRTMDEWLEQFDNFTADLDLFLTILGATGVLIAVFGIVNTMLMSVSERIIEFGILKANGWSRGDVLRLICSESLILGALGGLSGAVVGWAVCQALNAAFPDRLNLYAGPGLLSFAVVFSTVVGTLGGLYPALWAMRMQPMDAIRRG